MRCTARTEEYRNRIRKEALAKLSPQEQAILGLITRTAEEDW